MEQIYENDRTPSVKEESTATKSTQIQRSEKIPVSGNMEQLVAFLHLKKQQGSIPFYQAIQNLHQIYGNRVLQNVLQEHENLVDSKSLLLLGKENKKKNINMQV